MSQAPMNNLPPARMLLMMRIMWAALVLGQLVFFAVTVLMIIPSKNGLNPQPILTLVAWIMLAVFVPAMYVVRRFLFRRFMIDGMIPAPVYARGNLLFWAACEGVSFAGIVFGITNGTIWPTLPVVVIALALQALTFPVSSRLYNP